MSVAPIHAKLTIWERERNNKFRRGVNNCLLVNYDESSTTPILCSFPQKWSTSHYAAIGETLIIAYDPYVSLPGKRAHVAHFFKIELLIP